MSYATLIPRDSCPKAGGRRHLVMKTPLCETTSHRYLEALVPQYEALSRRYQEAWGLTCILTDVSGNVVHTNSLRRRCSKCTEDCATYRRRAISEAVQWGEPSMVLCGGDLIAWAVPVMHNSAVLGGVVVEQVEVETDGVDGLSAAQIHDAAEDLLDMAVDANVTNDSFLRFKREYACRESNRAAAIRELKRQSYRFIRDIYLLDEPALLTAVRNADCDAALDAINRILVGITHFGRSHPSLLKSFLLELVVTMSRSAVEAGADPCGLLSVNYSSFTDLHCLESEEELRQWMISMLYQIMDAMKADEKHLSSTLLTAALQYMEEHLQEDISRDEVAEVACLSPSHFSRVVKYNFGKSFTDLLTRMRVDRARELLARTDKSIVQIAMDCGFNGQSYFTKVFQRYAGITPGEYRRAQHLSFK